MRQRPAGCGSLKLRGGDEELLADPQAVHSGTTGDQLTTSRRRLESRADDPPCLYILGDLVDGAARLTGP
jgi:hypothetical protein